MGSSAGSDAPRVAAPRPGRGATAQRALWLSWILAACGGEAADLSTEQLSRVVAAQQPTLKRCYDTELERQPTARELRFEAAIHVAPSGRVTAVEIERGAAPEPLVSCLRDTIKRWEFPHAKEPTHTSLPLIFKPEVVPSGPNLDDVHQMLKKQIEADRGAPSQAPAQPPAR